MGNSLNLGWEKFLSPVALGFTSGSIKIATEVYIQVAFARNIIMLSSSERGRISSTAEWAGMRIPALPAAKYADFFQEFTVPLLPP